MAFRRTTHSFKALAAFYALGAVAQADTVTSIAVNGSGRAVSFEVEDSDGFTEEYTIETPSEGLTDSLQRWKDRGSDITVNDGDDGVVNEDDTITEN